MQLKGLYGVIDGRQHYKRFVSVIDNRQNLQEVFQVDMGLISNLQMTIGAKQ
jgi:hypothetical protein